MGLPGYAVHAHLTHIHHHSLPLAALTTPPWRLRARPRRLPGDTRHAPPATEEEAADGEEQRYIAVQNESPSAARQLTFELPDTDTDQPEVPQAPTHAH